MKILPPILDRYMAIRNHSLFHHLLLALLFVAWLAIVLTTVAQHEFWRDEVRALTLARQAASPLDLLHVIRHEGHPVLWYLLLYFGHTLFHTPLVLPAASLLIAAAAVGVFLWCAPFPTWFKALFVFSNLPLYTYSVMARNYGLGMLLFFVYAALYPQRKEKPWLLALILALLANSSVHAAILALPLAAAWAWESALQTPSWRDRFKRGPSTTLRGVGATFWGWLPFLIFALGFGLCVATTWPTPDTVLTKIAAVNFNQGLTSLGKALEHPGLSFAELLPDLSLPLQDALLYLLLLGLLAKPRLFLAGLAGQIALSVFFDLAYPGFLRHQGVYLVFLLSLYWLSWREADSKAASGAPLLRWLSKGVLTLIFGLALLLNIDSGLKLIRFDLERLMSSSQAMGAFIRAHPEYQDAILIPENDYIAESVPYYADNLHYFPREDRYGQAVSWTTAVARNYTLGELLSAARTVKASQGKPVLIVLSHRNLECERNAVNTYWYDKTFSWDAAQRGEFLAAVKKVAEFGEAAGDENYLVYELVK